MILLTCLHATATATAIATAMSEAMSEAKDASGAAAELRARIVGDWELDAFYIEKEGVGPVM